MAHITRNMTEKEIDEIISENLREFHTEEQVARYKLVTKICKKHSFGKDTLGTWLYAGYSDTNAKQAQSKIHAKPRRSFVPMESALIQALDLLAKEGYDVTNATFDKSEKLKIKKIK
jgi:hypothetical protein